MAQKNTIDGQRKAVIVPSDTAGLVKFAGLLVESEWTKIKKPVLFTIRELLGATLHVQELQGQLPPVGYEFPVALLEGRSKGRNGKAMASYLSERKAQRAAESEAFKKLQVIKASIL